MGVEQGTRVCQVGKGILNERTGLNKGQEVGRSVVGFGGAGSCDVARARLGSDWTQA